MAFPGLYCEVTHVPTKPTTTVPTAAVLTHVLHLLMYLLLYLRTYCCAVHTTSVCDRVDRYLYCTYILYARTAPTYVRTACTYWWCTYVYWRRKTTSCCKHAPTAHTAVPTDVRMYPRKLPAAVSTHLLHLLLFLLTYVRTHRTSCFNKCSKYTPTAQNSSTPCTYILLYVQLINVFIYLYCCTYILYLQ